MRAQVVLLNDDRILMTRHVCDDRTFWVLPGGAVEDGETAAQAASREVLEETGLAIVVERMLFVDGPRHTDAVRISSPRYTFLGRIVSGSLQQIEDAATGNPGKGRLVGAAWMPLYSPEFDAATQDTLELVARALERRLAADRASIQ